MIQYIKNNKQHIVATVLISIILISVFYLIARPSRNDGYIDLKVIFEEFEYTKELKKDFLTVDQARKKKLDSAEFELKVLAKKLEQSNEKDLANIFEVKRMDYIKMKQEFESQNGNLSAQYDEKIHKQISQYVKDFGKENGYDYVFGTEGLGNIVYGRDSKNITQEVLKYINRKYKGK